MLKYPIEKSIQATYWLYRLEVDPWVGPRLCSEPIGFICAAAKLLSRDFCLGIFPRPGGRWLQFLKICISCKNLSNWKMLFILMRTTSVDCQWSPVARTAMPHWSMAKLSMLCCQVMSCKEMSFLVLSCKKQFLSTSFPTLRTHDPPSPIKYGYNRSHQRTFLRNLLTW